MRESLALPVRASADGGTIAAQVAPWLPPDSERDLLRSIVNDFDAATRVFTLPALPALTNDTSRQLLEACRAVWFTGESLTPDALARHCAMQEARCSESIEATSSGTEAARFVAQQNQWRHCAQIAQGDLVTLPNGVADAAKHAEGIAKRLLKAPHFHFLTLSDVLTRPEPAFLVERLLTVGGTSLLTAKHASFKSFFALDIALSVALGGKFHNLACQQGRVVYVAAEGASGLKKRAAAWLQHHNAEAPEDLVILDRPFQVADAPQRAEFVAVTAPQQPKLIILDTLARCAVGLDENNAGDMGKFADALGDLARESGAHVLCVHHNNKNGEYRGSSALPAAVDTHLTLERHRESDAVTLITEKQKDAEELAPLSFEKIEVGLANSGGLGHSLVFGLVETAPGSRFSSSAMEQKVLAALEGISTESGVSAAQWKATTESLGVSNGTHYTAVKRLITPVEKRGLGLVAVVSGEHGKRGALYAPTLQNAPNEALE